MAAKSASIAVVLEVAGKRTFASALEWPGWSRSGRDEDAALASLLDYAPRYEAAIKSARKAFKMPRGVDEFEVVERLKGGATTDFGVPALSAEMESGPVSEEELKRLQALLAASWRTFGRIVAGAEGRELQKGPRGGGRDVDKIVYHVVESHYGYLKSIFWREPHDESAELASAIDAVIEADRKALAFAVSGEMPSKGPRGGTLWSPRYFARRSAWHILDHAWEIEDKLPAS